MGAFENFDEIVDTIFDEEILFAPSFSFDFIGEIILLLNLEEFSVSWLFFSIFSNLFELILSDEERFVRLTKHDESALIFTLRVWALTKDYWTVYFNILENIKREFDKNKIEIPFNQLDVHMIK